MKFKVGDIVIIKAYLEGTPPDTTKEYMDNRTHLRIGEIQEDVNYPIKVYNKEGNRIDDLKEEELEFAVITDWKTLITSEQNAGN